MSWDGDWTPPAPPAAPAASNCVLILGRPVAYRPHVCGTPPALHVPEGASWQCPDCGRRHILQPAYDDQGRARMWSRWVSIG